MLTPEPDTASMTLWQKIAAISKEVGHIEKTGKNAHFNYNFIEHSNVVGTLRPILDQYGITIDLEAMDATFTPGDRSTRVLLHMRYTVTNADKPEETFSRLWVSEAMDQQDKGINKALTAAEKNVFMKLFHISDVDPDDDSNNQPTPKTTQGQGKPLPAARPVTQSAPIQAGVKPLPPKVSPGIVVIGDSKASCPKCDGPMELLKVVEEDGNTFQGERCVAKGCGYKRKAS